MCEDILNTWMSDNNYNIFTVENRNHKSLYISENTLITPFYSYDYSIYIYEDILHTCFVYPIPKIMYDKYIKQLILDKYIDVDNMDIIYDLNSVIIDIKNDFNITHGDYSILADTIDFSKHVLHFVELTHYLYIIKTLQDESYINLFLDNKLYSDDYINKILIEKYEQ